MWSELPYCLLELIIDKLLILSPHFNTADYIRFGAVCTSWRHVFIHHSHPHDLLLHHRLGLPPFLIVATPSSSSSSSPPSSSSSKKKKKNKKIISTTKSLSFYNIIYNRIHNQFQITIPSNTHFYGSSYGWLVAVDQVVVDQEDDDYDCQLRLFNPFTNNTILLPSMKNLPFRKYPCIISTDHSSPSHAYLRKAVLSADPLSNPADYIVMAIFDASSRLAYYKPGDEKWTLVETDHFDNEFHDVLYCKGMFLVLNNHGVVLILDPKLNMKAMAETLPPPTPESTPLLPGSMYLVQQASGRVFQVQRFMQLGKYDKIAKKRHYKTSKFRVMRFQGGDGINLHRWVDTKSLFDHAIFLGNSDTMCISPPEGCKPNAIYFTDDFYYQNRPHDLGVFNLEDETIKNYYPTDQYTPTWPIWIQPGLQKIEGGGGEGLMF